MKLGAIWTRRLIRLITILYLLSLVAVPIFWLLWYLDGGGFETIYAAVIAIPAGLQTARGWLKETKSPAEAELLPQNPLQDPRRRKNLLETIHTYWIANQLNQNIHGEPIELSLHYKPGAMGPYPRGLAFHQAGKKDQPIPPNYDLPQIFAESGRNLLILGQPGSGKTFTMLRLADALLTEARDLTAPLPIIVNLPSWAQKQLPLADWLAEELFIQHGTPHHVTRAGIAHNQFLYILDGLDGVTGAVRDACVATINDFKTEHLAEMVICCRSEEYGTLKEQLRMGATIEIQPLTSEQIDHYLSQAGLQLQAVRTTLKTDPEIRKLAETPLMLSIMTLAYQGEEKIDLRPRAGKEIRRRIIFDHYIEKNFENRPLPAGSPYTQQQAINWLTHLAFGLQRNGQLAFHIDRLLPTWLPDNRWRGRYMLIIWLIIGPFIALSAGLMYGMVFGLLYGLLIVVLSGLFITYILLKEKPPAINSFILDSFHETITIKLPALRILWGFVFIGLIIGLGTGLIYGLIFELYDRFIAQLNFGFKDVLIGGLIFGLISGLISWLILAVKFDELPQRMQPNQGIYLTGKNALKMMLIGGLISGLIYELIFKPIGGLIGGLTSGLMIGLLAGGLTVIEHYTLRYLLSQAGILPYPFRDDRLVAYLDDMHERLLLRRVDSGWHFVHRPLMEHFASLANKRTESE